MSIFGFILMGSVVLFMYSPSCVLYSAWSSVKSVHVGLSALGNEIVCVCPCILFVYRHDCMFAFAEILSMCVDVVWCLWGMSDVYILNSVCDRTLLCGTIHPF